ncbi:dickkopf-related protein 4-like [Scyliorhinus canicula]|uniref:dickkopf-related protein 4-like n=1 Tax=Scyliorhinus canicula TaxID=7830 RepID=UPI0018F7506A|nr:dickkopf-related protein 4-like [Scyliorhinus canicula]
MGCAVTLLLCCLFGALSALVLDSNTIRSSAEIGQAPTKQESRCLVDPDCGPGRFCLTSRPEQPICSVCRGLRRRCQRDGMCCSGSHCLNDVCTRSEGQAAETPSEATRSRKTKGGKRPKKPNTQKIKETRRKNQKEKPNKAQISKALEGETCLRTSDCSAGFCCARHFWSKICRPVLKDGQVCSKRGRKEGPQGPEIFQRCDCGPGLACRNQNQGRSQSNSRLRVCQRV